MHSKKRTRQCILAMCANVLHDFWNIWSLTPKKSQFCTSSKHLHSKKRTRQYRQITHNFEKCTKNEIRFTAVQFHAQNCYWFEFWSALTLVRSKSETHFEIEQFCPWNKVHISCSFQQFYIVTVDYTGSSIYFGPGWIAIFSICNDNYFKFLSQNKGIGVVVKGLLNLPLLSVTFASNLRE